MRYQPPFSLPIEFALAAACCRWVYAHDGADRVGQLARVVWPAFLATCQRHRVQGLAWRGLSGLGLDRGMAPPVRLALQADARAIARQGLRLASDSVRLAQGFDDAGVPVLFLKGLAIGALAYGDPFVKMGWDIDILVAPADIGRAASLLEDMGFKLVLPERIQRLQGWHDSNKESVWKHRSGTVIELHSRLADQPQLLPQLNVASARQSVAIGPASVLPTLADEELFAYLCVHGASSAWFRLKWIADLAGFLHGRDQSALVGFYAAAERLGAGRAPAQALILAQWLFGTTIDDQLERTMATRTNLWLARTALAQMLRGEPTERLLGTVPIHLTQFLLVPGVRYKVAELRRQAASAVSARRG